MQTAPSSTGRGGMFVPSAQSTTVKRWWAWIPHEKSGVTPRLSDAATQPLTWSTHSGWRTVRTVQMGTAPQG